MAASFTPAAALLIAAGLTLTACGGSTGASSQPSERAPMAADGQVTHILELQKAYIGAGGDCEAGKDWGHVAWAEETMECDSDTMIDVFQSAAEIEKYKQSEIAADKQMGVGLAHVWIQGGNWLVREAYEEDALRIQKRLGGEIIRFNTGGK